MFWNLFHADDNDDEQTADPDGSGLHFKLIGTAIGWFPCSFLFVCLLICLSVCFSPVLVLFSLISAFLARMQYQFQHCWPKYSIKTTVIKTILFPPHWFAENKGGGIFLFIYLFIYYYYYYDDYYYHYCNWYR